MSCRSRFAIRGLRPWALLFILSWTSCSYVGTFVPSRAPGVRVLSRCWENDSTELKKANVAVTASGSWSNSLSEFFVTVANQSPASIELVPESIAATSGDSRVSADWLVTGGKFYDLPASRSVEQADPHSPRQDDADSIPTLVAAGSERLFQFSMDALFWKKFEGRRVILTVPVLMDDRVVVFELPFTVGSNNKPHFGGACPLGVHPSCSDSAPC